MTVRDEEWNDELYHQGWEDGYASATEGLRGLVPPDPFVQKLLALFCEYLDDRGHWAEALGKIDELVAEERVSFVGAPKDA